jgi:hypothetical protein
MSFITGLIDQSILLQVQDKTELRIPSVITRTDCTNQTSDKPVNSATPHHLHFYVHLVGCQ